MSNLMCAVQNLNFNEKLILHSPLFCPNSYKHSNTHYIDKKYTDNNFGSLYNVLCSQTVSACSCVLTELTRASQAHAGGEGGRRRGEAGATRLWRRGAPRRPFGTRRSSDPWTAPHTPAPLAPPAPAAAAVARRPRTSYYS